MEVISSSRATVHRLTDGEKQRVTKEKREKQGGRKTDVGEKE